MRGNWQVRAPGGLNIRTRRQARTAAKAPTAASAALPAVGRSAQARGWLRAMTRPGSVKNMLDRAGTARRFQALLIRLRRVTSMRTRKPSVLLTPSGMLELASHAAMGIALGLAFAFVLTRIPSLGVMTLIDHSVAPDSAMLMFVGTFAMTFGVGATLTGLVFMMTEDG